MGELMPKFKSKLSSPFCLWVIGGLLFVVLTLLTYGMVMQQTISEDFINDTFQKINFYNRFDTHYFGDYRVGENSDISSYEDLPRGQRTAGYLFEQIDRTEVLRDNSEKIVPELVAYLTGETDELELMLSLQVLEEELIRQLENIDSFKKILELELPDQAQIFSGLPEDFQRHFHQVIKDELIADVNIPGELPVRYFVEEENIFKFIDNLRGNTSLFQNGFNVLVILSVALVVFLFVVAKFRGLIVTSIALIMAGIISLALPIIFSFNLVVVWYTGMADRGGIISDLMYQAFQKAQPMGIGYLASGVILLGICLLFCHYRKRD